jgi:hypothetical protein
MFYRNLLPRRPLTGQSRYALSPWLPPSSYGRGGRSGHVFHHRQRREGAAPPAERLAPCSASCRLRRTFVQTGTGSGGRLGNGVQLQEAASRALPEKHMHAPVVGQIGPKLLQLLRGGLVLKHARRLVSLIRHRDIGLINADKNSTTLLGGFCKPSRAASCLAFPETPQGSS